jgi:hypothetical protein
MIEEYQATLKIPLLENQIRKLLVRNVELLKERDAALNLIQTQAEVITKLEAERGAGQ